jgi:hypothetical protein
MLLFDSGRQSSLSAHLIPALCRSDSGTRHPQLAGGSSFHMARVYPFRAWRFGPSRVRLQEVVTRPCERICAPIEKAFDRPSSFRPVPILLELPEFFDAVPGESVYYREAHDFQAWLEVGIPAGEKEPAIFACLKRYTPPGTDVVIVPAPRVADSLKNLDRNQFRVAGREFHPVKPAADSPALAFRNLPGGQQGTAFVPGTRAGGWRVRSKPEAGASRWAGSPERRRQPRGCRFRSIARKRISGKRICGPSARQIPRPASLPTSSDLDRAAVQFRHGEAGIALPAHPVPRKQRQQATCEDDVPRPRSSDLFPKPLSGLAIYALD